MTSKFTDLQCAPEPKESLHEMLESYTIKEEYHFNGELGDKPDSNIPEDEEEKLLNKDNEFETSKRRYARSSSESSADSFTKSQLKRRDSSFKYEDYKKNMYSSGHMFT